MSLSFSGRSLFFEVMRCHNSCRWSRKCFAMLYNFHIHYLWHHCRYHHRHSRESWQEPRIHPYRHLKSMMFQFRRCTYMRLNIILLFEIILVIITTLLIWRMKMLILRCKLPVVVLMPTTARKMQNIRTFILNNFLVLSIMEYSIRVKIDVL